MVDDSVKTSSEVLVSPEGCKGLKLTDLLLEGECMLLAFNETDLASFIIRDSSQVIKRRTFNVVRYSMGS